VTTTRRSDFTRTRATRTPPSHDPLGKSALFSSGTASQNAAPAGLVSGAPPEAQGRGASHLFSQAEARPGTLIVDCSGCRRRTRVTYAEFAALHFPAWLWIPSPLRTHRHWLRCPACHRFTWLRARWLE
jgi:hypothetical protein